MAQNENIIYVTLTEERIDEALGVANEIFVRYANRLVRKILTTL